MPVPILKVFLPPNESVDLLVNPVVTEVQLDEVIVFVTVQALGCCVNEAKVVDD